MLKGVKAELSLQYQIPELVIIKNFYKIRNLYKILSI